MRSQREWSQQRGQITIEKDGKTYTGMWTLEGGVITMRALGEVRRTHHTAGVKPEHVARNLLREIVQGRGTEQKDAPA